MAGNDEVMLRRNQLATDQILDAAEKLFTEHGPDAVGMNDIAATAGCSRATLYRYFDNREALRTAYVHREAHRLHDAIKDQLTGIDEPRQRLIAGLTITLRSVRRSSALASWFASTAPPIGAEVAEHSEVISALAAGFVDSLGFGEPETVERRARWLVRIITSLLMFPGRDASDEAAMLDEFVIPVLVGPDQLSGRSVR
jgi:AcrR family transcriptional regulator